MEVREDVVAYSQIIEILQYISDSDYYKIPKKERDFYFEHSDPKYYFNYDPSKSLEENDVSDKTKKILAYLFKEYWATESQKEKIESYNRVYYAKIEGEKKQKYSVDNIFGNVPKYQEQVQKADAEEIKEESKELLVIKENIFTKVIKRIKEIFSKKC